MNKKCLWCGEKIDESRKKYCSHKCCAKYFYHIGINKIPVCKTHKKLVEMEWDYEENNKLGLNPEKLTYSSHKQVFWICPVNQSHRWQASLNSRTNITNGGNGCPYCSGYKVSEDNCLATKFPEISQEWDYKKNEGMSPRNVVACSGKKVWWKCSYGHEWKAQISNRTHSGNNCPYCDGHAVCEDNCLFTKFPDIAKEWHPTKNKEFTSKDVTIGSKKKIWWRCYNNHVWKATVNSRTSQYLNSKTIDSNGCPYCSGQKVCKDNCLSTKFPDIAKEWNYERNKKIMPENVTYGSSKKVWWICNKGHEWKANIRSRTGRGDGCPQCKYKNEGKVKELLLRYFKDWTIVPNKKIWDEYKNYNHKRYCDFWIEKDKVKIIVEYDGEQHFKPISFGCKDKEKVEKLFRKTQLKDSLDAQFCEENNIMLHRIKYNEDKEISIEELKRKL